MHSSVYPYMYLPLATNAPRTLFGGGGIKSLTNFTIKTHIIIAVILSLRIHQNRCRLGRRPRPQLGELTALPQIPYLVSRGCLTAGRERRGGLGEEGRQEAWESGGE